MSLDAIAGREPEVLVALMRHDYADLAGPGISCWGMGAQKKPNLEVGSAGIRTGALLRRIKSVIPDFPGGEAEAGAIRDGLMARIIQDEELAQIALGRASY